MKQIRENIWQVTHGDLGKPEHKGYYKVSLLGEVMLDHADIDYIKAAKEQGFEPLFHVSRSEALNGAFVVISRQRWA